MENNQLQSRNSNSASQHQRKMMRSLFMTYGRKTVLGRFGLCESCNNYQLLDQIFETVPHTLWTNMNSNITMKDIVLAGLSFPVIVAIILPQSGILYRQTHSISSSTHALPVVTDEKKSSEGVWLDCSLNNICICNTTTLMLHKIVCSDTSKHPLCI